MATVEASSGSPSTNPGIAAVLSVFVWGLGQIYNGEIGKGIALVILWMIMGTFVFLFWWFFFLPVILSFPIWIWNIYDAYNGATR